MTRTAVVGGVLLLFVAPSARADEDAPDVDAPVHEESVFVETSVPYLPATNTIATKLPVALERTPANVGVVTSAQLVEQGAEVLGDALENVSGLNVQTGSGVFDYFVVRGFDSLTSGLVLTDGAPEPEASFYQMYNAERVEVLKGPGGFLYGSNALAGVVNIVRKQPVPASFGVLALEGGSFETWGGTVDWNTASASGTLSFRLNGLWRESGGYRDGLDSTVGGLNPALAWTPDDHSRLNVSLELGRSDFLPDAGLPLVGGELPDVPRDRTYHSPFDFSEQDTERLQVDYEIQLSPRLSLRNKAYSRTLDWQTDGTLFGFVVPNASGSVDVTRSLLGLDDRQEYLGDQLEITWRGSTGAIEHTVLAGIEVAELTDEYGLDVAILPSIGVFAPVETAQEPLFFLPGQSARGDARTRVVAPYVVDQISLSDRFEVLVGLRWDDLDYSDEVTGTDRSHGELSPSVGLLWAPRTDLALFANAGRSFAPPSTRVAGPREPEESQQLELGLRGTLLEGRVRSTIAAFEIERENIAIPDDNGFTQQAGDQRARGVELELGGELPGGWRGSFSYAYTDSELTRFAETVLVGFFPPAYATVDRSGNRSAFAPEHLANLWLGRSWGGLSVGAGLRYVDEQFVSEDNSVAIDAALALDTAVAYRFADWRIALNLENVTDESFETRGFGSSSVIPARPFAATLHLEYRR